MAEDLKFIINGAEYPIPQLDTLTIDECGIFYEWANVYVEDIDDTPVNSKMIAAFMQIAYMRGNLGVKAQIARELVGASNFAEALERFNAAAKDDADPPAVAPPSGPNEPVSSGETNSPPPSSGTDSTNGSDTAANEPKDSGTPKSVESAAFRSLTSAA
jgi:hypothetical protein